jgi:hypothetical protein
MAKMSKILRPIEYLRQARRGAAFAQRAWKRPTGSAQEPKNPLMDYFQSNDSGPGIWKWNHYFEIYHRHLSKFRNTECYVMEIGVYSGGSLGMWRNYFGEKAHIYGIDIQDDCKVYEQDAVKIFIGDQADRSFWKRVKDEVPKLDVLIDDGGHTTQQQIVTLEEMLPRLAPGGVYICEDVHGTRNHFLFYIAGLTCELHETTPVQDLQNSERRISSGANDFQASIHSIHHYPFVTVIEKKDREMSEFVSPKRGTVWQPFLQ